MIEAKDFGKAHRDARRSGRSFAEVIETEFSVTPCDAMTEIGRAFNYPVLDMPALNRYAPAFDLVPFAEVA
ncbi:MAG TPA: hypothetical protein PLK99_04990, partial [Burkholderiales bacterium]|nr:hypothetical protein [Burkholderiales bacterium]